MSSSGELKVSTTNGELKVSSTNGERSDPDDWVGQHDERELVNNGPLRSPGS